MSGFAVHWSADGLLVIGIAAPASRPEARKLIRQAARAAAAQWLGMEFDSITVESLPGQPPHLLLAGGEAGLSFSHDEGLSLAAIHLHGPIGIDVMRVVDVPDWQAVARDYLGPQVTKELAACPDARRAQRFAQAWTAREAALKCTGLPLAEWSAAGSDCRLQLLAMPQDYIATLALPGTSVRAD